VKKILVLVLATAMLFVAGSAFALLSTTPHNLLNAANGVYDNTDANATMCGFCHIPHGAQGTAATVGAPLWARNNPAAATFTAYGTTLSGTTAGAPGVHSLTCLSCHDGVTAIGIVYKNGDTAGSPSVTYTMSGADQAAGVLSAAEFVIGQDLTNDHPVGIQYITGNAAGLGNLTAGTGGYYTIGTGAYRVYGATATTGNTGGTVECASCHDPHTSADMFLRGPDTTGATDYHATICQDCHSLK
jgi:hypothetical protein